jgi:hypothetical protein
MGGRGHPLVETKPAPATETACRTQPGGAERNMATATVPLCQHWMDTTTRCQSPAMRGTRYCYSHHLQQARSARKNAESARQRWFESVPLQDAASVQRALRQVMTRLLSGNIGHRRAGQILYKLQTASVNLRSPRDAALKRPMTNPCKRAPQVGQRREREVAQGDG